MSYLQDNIINWNDVKNYSSDIYEMSFWNVPIYYNQISKFFRQTVLHRNLWYGEAGMIQFVVDSSPRTSLPELNLLSLPRISITIWILNTRVDGDLTCTMEWSRSWIWIYKRRLNSFCVFSDLLHETLPHFIKCGG